MTRAIPVGREAERAGMGRSDPEITEARLSSGVALPGHVRQPGYARARLRPRILHLGPGAFHRAHQAVATDAANEAGGDWGITGVSPRSEAAAAALNPQGGLYSLLIRRPERTDIRVVGALTRVLVAPREPGALLARFAAPETAIVSLTVTEKAYAIADGRLDLAHPEIAADLAAPDVPRSLIGWLVRGLAARRSAGGAPLTLLCCDNLPGNGTLLKRLVLDFAGATDASLARWIEGEIAFPATMVDRITPAPTAATRAEAARRLGVADHAAIETEPFSQWVIEDAFAGPRPGWEAGGAQFVSDVAPYETMKLRMLNGAHSLIAYAGHVAGLALVREAMAHEALAAVVRAHLKAAAQTVTGIPEDELRRYADALLARFANPAIAHETYQIAMDGTQKLPQRLIAPAAEALATGVGVETFTFAVAAWMRYCEGRTDAGAAYALRDPREAEIAAALRDDPDPVAALHRLPGLFPPALRDDPRWLTRVAHWHRLMATRGMAAALAASAEALEPETATNGKAP